MLGRTKYVFLVTIPLVLLISCNVKEGRQTEDFNAQWKFINGDDSLAFQKTYDDSPWRMLNLPHDWSIEGSFSEDHPTRQAGGGLPTGVGWYRKTFKVSEFYRKRKVFIEFDGIYRNSEVWINGYYLGKRPNGYISFRYDISQYLNFGEEENVMAVKVDNSLQPASRWYTGSGIYRNVRLVYTNNICIGHWGVFVTTPEVDENRSKVNVEFWIDNYNGRSEKISYQTKIYNSNNRLVAETDKIPYNIYESQQFTQDLEIKNPKLWSVDNPELYKAEITIFDGFKKLDIYEQTFGIRFFNFDAKTGFSLNGKPLKILGVCNHHDLGALGAAVNERAIERHLEILKEMGCNAIRTAHNPPAPELLDLCDKMGFLVMDEAFDAWRKKKAKKDYHLFWDEWHKRDLQDFIKRDRNHPSVIIWSIGNEIREQFDSTGISITRELVNIVKSLDKTRPVTCALTENIPEKNYIFQSGALDVLSFNYKQNDYKNFPEWYPGEPVIASENMSAFATRGVYNMPSDSIQRWPEAYNVPLKNPNPDFTVSAYDHISAYWGSTHEETWKVVKNLDYIAGLFVWSGFDFLGEPVPYPWPARSSYYGIIDLAGFPKDSYYMYQSEWTDKPVLHVFPHWNWEEGQIVDVWAYYNNADEAELFLNNISMGIRKKKEDEFHVMWRLKYEPGKIKVETRKDHKKILEKVIKTAGQPWQIDMQADRKQINADGKDLSFIIVSILDKNGNLVPNANNEINFSLEGNGYIAGIDNGYQADLDSFKGCKKKVFKGKCVLIIGSEKQPGEINILSESVGLKSKSIEIKTK